LSYRASEVPRLVAHLKSLCDSGADIVPFPDAGDLTASWGADPWSVGYLVAKVREACPPGYIVPFVCQYTNNKLIMVRGNGNLFSYAVMALMCDIKYCRTRVRRIARNIRNMAAGFPAGSAFRAMAEGFASVLEGVTAHQVGAFDLVIAQLPLLATRAARAERELLRELANKYVA
jgi:hypothetical protein